MDKRKIVIFFIILVLVIAGTVFIIRKNNYPKIINTNNNQIEQGRGNNNLTEEEKKNIINGMKDEIKDTTNKAVLFVNNEKISERELAFEKYQLNNSTLNNNNVESAEDRIIKRYIVCQNAQELNLTLTDKEIEEIRSVVRYDEDMKELLKELNMSYDEYAEMYIHNRMQAELEMKWIACIGDKITNGEINIDSQSFNSKYEEYKENKNISKRAQLLLEMLEVYKEYLVKQANIEKID